MKTQTETIEFRCALDSAILIVGEVFASVASLRDFLRSLMRYGQSPNEIECRLIDTEVAVARLRAEAHNDWAPDVSWWPGAIDEGIRTDITTPTSSRLVVFEELIGEDRAGEVKVFVGFGPKGSTNAAGQLKELLAKAGIPFKEELVEEAELEAAEAQGVEIEDRLAG